MIFVWIVCRVLCFCVVLCFCGFGIVVLILRVFTIVGLILCLLYNGVCIVCYAIACFFVFVSNFVWFVDLLCFGCFVFVMCF